jgi:hypothetical protein
MNHAAASQGIAGHGYVGGYIGTAQVPDTAPVSEIDGQVNRLANGLQLLELSLDTLGGRLGPFICEPTIGKGDAKPREVCGSSFGQQLQTQADRAHALNARIEYLMACLRV